MATLLKEMPSNELETIPTVRIRHVFHVGSLEDQISPPATNRPSCLDINQNPVEWALGHHQGDQAITWLQGDGHFLDMVRLSDAGLRDLMGWAKSSGQLLESAPALLDRLFAPNCVDHAAALYAREHGYDGLWWEASFYPELGMLPYGLILPERLPRWEAQEMSRQDLPAVVSTAAQGVMPGAYDEIDAEAHWLMSRVDSIQAF